MKFKLNKTGSGLLVWMLVTTVLLVLYLCFGTKDNVIRLFGTLRVVHEQEQQISERERQIEQMDEFLGSINNSVDSLETYAREKYNFAKPGEDVYIVEQ